MKKKQFSLNDPIELYEQMTFHHIYFTSGFNISKSITTDGKEYKPPSSHGCIRMGYWCWSNFFQRPFDIIPYIQRGLKRLRLHSK